MATFSYALVGLTFLGPLVVAVPVPAGEGFSVETFAASRRFVTGADREALRRAIVTTYRVNGLEQFESTLSEGLPTDTEVAKREVLRRIHQLDEARMAPAKNAAIGLAKAVEYGVDRYPAIVFDGRAVIYGVTDLVDAVARYEAWREAQAR